MTDTVTVSTERLRQVLETLEHLHGLDTETECVTICLNDEIDTLRAALDATCQDSRQVPAAADKSSIAAEWVRCAATGAQHDVREIIADMQTAPVQEPVHKLIYPGGGKALFNRLWHLTCNAVATQSGMRVRTDVMPMREMKEFLDHLCVLVDSPPLPAPVQEPVLYDDQEAMRIFFAAKAGSEKPVGTLRGLRAVVAWWEGQPRPAGYLVPAHQTVPKVQWQQKTGKEYIDSLIDSLLLPMGAMSASDVAELHNQCAQMLLLCSKAQPRKAVKLTPEEIGKAIAAVDRDIYTATKREALISRAIEAAVLKANGVEE